MAAIAGALHHGADRAQIDHAVAHHATIEQQIGGWQEPIIDVVGEDVLARARDLLLEVRIPPHVIGVDHDAGALAQFLAEVVRLRERIHAGAVRRVHRVERLDRERHARFSRVRQKRMQRVAHLHARADDVARAFRQAADHEHEALRADGGRLVDGAAVVVDRGAAGGFIGGRKHAAAAEPGDGHVMRADELSRPLGPARLHDVAPGRDRG